MDRHTENLDNDGDLDLVVNNVNMPAFIYQNKTSDSGLNNFIKVNFKGDKANPFGIGATVKVIDKDREITAQNYQSRGFQSSTEPVVTLGIGQAKEVDVMVTWPSGKSETKEDMASNSNITFIEREASNSVEEDVPAQGEFAELNNLINSENGLRHVEGMYNDFDNEPLMLRMLSREGPKILIGDINLDNRQDFVLLGSSETTERTFIQNENSTFTELDQPGFLVDKSFESTAAVLTDIDNDTDLDLVIGSGGNDARKGFQSYQTRAYLNDGYGIFKKHLSILPAATGAMSVVEELRIDQDGNKGLFLGGQYVPGVYGLTPRNYIMRTEGVRWVDRTEQENGQTGMVTDAKAADLDNDGDDDLIVGGEWMPIMLFENQNGALIKKGEIPNSSGLWQNLTVADFDEDGFVDLFAGNWGENSKLKATPELPLGIISQ